MTIASAPLPPRVRRVLQGLFDHIANDMVSALGGMLVEFEQRLFKEAEQARNNQRQAELFVNLRALQKNRGELAPHFMFGLEAELAGIRTPRAAPGDKSPAKLDYQTLTLVEDAVMDQEIVLREVARRHEQRGNAQILMLGQRFGVLAGSPAFEADTLPLGPYRLCNVLKDASATLELALDAQLVLYRTFDHKVMHNYTEWVATMNEFLAREGILRGLAYAPRRVRNLEAEIRRHPRDAGTARPMTGWQGGMSHWATLTPEQLQAVAGALTGTAAGTPDAAGGDAHALAAGGGGSGGGGGAGAGASAGGAPAAGDGLAGSFEVLQKLLAIRRQGMQADAWTQGGDAGGDAAAGWPSQDMPGGAAEAGAGGGSGSGGGSSGGGGGFGGGGGGYGGGGGGFRGGGGGGGFRGGGGGGMPPQVVGEGKGVVKFFNAQKGFGFVVRDDGGEDVFVHISAVEQAGLTGLAEGQPLEFTLVDRGGRISATDLKIEGDPLPVEDRGPPRDRDGGGFGGDRGGPQRELTGEKATGTVKFFNATKGFGFITRDDGQPDAFVHISAMQRANIHSLQEGDRLEFELEVDRRGKTAAVNLVSIA